MKSWKRLFGILEVIAENINLNTQMLRPYQNSHLSFLYQLTYVPTDSKSNP